MHMLVITFDINDTWGFFGNSVYAERFACNFSFHSVIIGINKINNVKSTLLSQHIIDIRQNVNLLSKTDRAIQGKFCNP